MNTEKDFTGMICVECNHKAHVLIQYFGIPPYISSSIPPHIQRAIQKSIQPSKPTRIPFCIECIGEFMKLNPEYLIVGSCNNAKLSQWQKVVYGDDGFYLPLKQIDQKPGSNDRKRMSGWLPKDKVLDLNMIQERCKSCDKMVDCLDATAQYPQTKCPKYVHEGQ
jgi:hypothetical protein